MYLSLNICLYRSRTFYLYLRSSFGEIKEFSDDYYRNILDEKDLQDEMVRAGDSHLPFIPVGR